MEASESSNKADMKLNTLLVNMRIVQEEKNTLESKLSQKETICQAQVCKNKFYDRNNKKNMNSIFYTN